MKLPEKQVISGHREGIERSSVCAGEYLESIGKTDLSCLKEHEWFMLLDVIIKNYLDKISEFPPF